jgi:hypothetical protein
METMRKQNTENVEKLVSSTIKKGKWLICCCGKLNSHYVI